MSEATSSILQNVDNMLSAAKFGLEDFLNSHDSDRKRAGLYNAVTFGRSVTFVLQKLRSTESGFDSWYGEYLLEMKSDPLMSFLNVLRSKILKEGELNTIRNVTFSGNPYAISDQSPPPPGICAKAFFIADSLGGSGWEIELPDGSTAKYYVKIPSDLPNFDLNIKTYFSEAPPQLSETPIEEILSRYISYLERIVQAAKQRFN